MKRLPVGAYLIAPALAFAVLAVIMYRDSAEANAALDQRAAEIARLEDEVKGLSVRADSLEAAADSLGQLARRSADTVRVEVDRYREVAARLRLRLDSLRAMAPDSSAGLTPIDLSDIEVVLGRADSMALACTTLTRDCDQALAAKDSALAARDSVLAVQARRALLLEQYRADLAARLRSAERQRWLFGLGGAGLAVAACWATH